MDHPQPVHILLDRWDGRTKDYLVRCPCRDVLRLYQLISPVCRGRLPRCSSKRPPDTTEPLHARWSAHPWEKATYHHHASSPCRIDRRGEGSYLSPYSLTGDARFEADLSSDPNQLPSSSPSSSSVKRQSARHRFSTPISGTPPRTSRPAG